MLLGVTPLVMRCCASTGGCAVGDTWGCGRIGQTPRMEYTATAFAEPLRRVFAEFYRPTKELTIDFHPESKYFVQSIEYKSEITPLFERGLYEPFFRLVRFLARQVRRLQAGSLHLYLAYVMRDLASFCCWLQGGSEMIGYLLGSHASGVGAVAGAGAGRVCPLAEGAAAKPARRAAVAALLRTDQALWQRSGDVEQRLVAVSLCAVHRLCQHRGRHLACPAD